MEVKPTKTVRFSQVVESAGNPVPVTLWTAPEDNPDFTKAMDERRVLTVIQRSVGAKADYGLVGFFKEPLATYLVFPKELLYPSGTKVVGIKYEQLAEPKPSGPLHQPKKDRPTGMRRPEKTRPLPAPQKKENNQRAIRELVASKPPPEEVRAEPVKPPPPPPRLNRFSVEVEIQTRKVVSIEMEARSATEAARLAKQRASELHPSLADARVTRRVARPRLISK
jgi:hypothetical protein